MNPLATGPHIQGYSPPSFSTYTKGAIGSGPIDPGATPPDKIVAGHLAAIIHLALSHTNEPNAKAAYVSALNALTKYLASDKPSRQPAIAKLAPKLLDKAYGKKPAI